ncbi:MAG: 16S rRNA (cytosine(1402)-N(4))-methyltransferase RsmH [Acidobacteria bacterium]|nr:16S rRNA (cytosine(1402)-N(4))-methyltransferase RsmH [Acidobacteriota bacterium]
MTDFSRNPDFEHLPVMLEEAIESLQCKPGGIYVDGTVGLGGHAHTILQKILPEGLLIGIDRDKESLDKANERLKPFAHSIRLVHDNYKNLPLILNNLDVGPVDGILVDLGVSSYQLLSSERGFSIHSDVNLDMRMDRSQRWTAADIVNNTPESELANLIYRYGEEKLSRRIAAAIVRERSKGPIARCSQLSEIISRTIKGRGRQTIHPATRTFQALRIAVNEELEGLEKFLIEATGFLKPGGRIVTIAFHSLEDRIIKKTLRKLAGQCVCEAPPELCRCPRQAVGRLTHTRPITPKREELAVNPRARSARLRALEKL